MTIKQIADFMKENYSFPGNPSQFKYHFHKWEIHRRVLTSEKDAIATALGKRSYPGTSTSDVTIHQGGVVKSVNKHQLKRQMRAELSKPVVISILPGVLSSWNLPYAAYAKSVSGIPIWGDDSDSGLLGGSACHPRAAGLRPITNGGTSPTEGHARQVKPPPAGTPCGAPLKMREGGSSVSIPGPKSSKLR
ncbi:uncharacterized protein DNG_07855 [Cephalotrichum gorgonifer]|uniref:Clr5 domain-containing protein n=1 Tax=Cephalotrichum gorgonifer TaxID=2041049 RepID=A0AAE8N472_9PEZI|nr:uncharacterized protein DNG_07855 [Cephalotrichum gorgonifer]